MTVDRTTKFLLSAIVLLLTGILVRPMLAPIPAQAQSHLNPPYAPSQMVVDKSAVYLLQGETLSIYKVDENEGTTGPGEHPFKLYAQKHVSP